MNRVAVATGARAAQLTTGTRRGRRCRRDRLGRYQLARRPDPPRIRRLSASRTGSASPRSLTSSTGGPRPIDDHGHGTHVAGIIAGNGADSLGVRAGIAPSAHILSLKVLDDRGRGVISDVIAALEWAVTNRTAYNVRVVNLSVGAAVTESFNTDPLTLAASAPSTPASSSSLRPATSGRTLTGSRSRADHGPGNAPGC